MVDTAHAARLVEAIEHLHYELGVYSSISYAVLADQDEVKASFQVVRGLASQLNLSSPQSLPRMRRHEASGEGFGFVCHWAEPSVWEAWEHEMKALLAAAREMALPTHERARLPLLTGNHQTESGGGGENRSELEPGNPADVTLAITMIIQAHQAGEKITVTQLAAAIGEKNRTAIYSGKQYRGVREMANKLFGLFEKQCKKGDWDGAHQGDVESPRQKDV